MGPDRSGTPPRRPVPPGPTDRRRPALPQSRPARAAAAVVTALATAVGGHLLATGTAPPPAGILLAAAVMLVPAWWLARDERGWERLASAQLVAQFGSHALFVVTAVGPVAHLHHVRSGSELVVVAHVLGAALAGAWLRCGERRAVAAARHALAALRCLVGRLLGRRSPEPPALLVRRDPGPAPRGAPAARLRHAIVHRGPPAVC